MLRPCKFFEQLAQLGIVNWFDKVGVESSLPRTLTVLFLAPTRKCDKHHILSPRLFAYHLSRFIATELRHPDVEQHDVGTEFFRPLDPFKTIKGRLDLVTKVL